MTVREAATLPGSPRVLSRLLTLVAGTLLAACAGPRVGDYAAERPVLDIRSYFNGPIDAYGVFADRGGKVVKRFVVTMACSWNGDQGTLDESFRYSDGTTQHRTWHLVRQADGTYRGTAGDVIGEATGESAGNAFNLRYTLAVPVDGKTWHFQFDDWMFAVDEHRVINRAVMSKFGFRVGEVIVAFSRA